MTKERRNRDADVSPHLLYHGSPFGIKGDIVAKSENICDFGVGFYTATDIDYAASNFLGGDEETGFLYTLKIDMAPFKTYCFRDLEFWALYTVYNREYITTIDDYPLLKNKIETLSQYDILIGLIADDRSAYAFNRFVSGDMTFACLEKCINHFDVGYQYVFKNDFVCKSIEIEEEKLIQGQEYDEYYHKHKVRIGSSVEIVKKYEKEYRNVGEYLEDILERYG